MEAIEKLYNALVKGKYYTKSFEEFLVQFEQPEYADKVFETLTRDEFYTGSRESFHAQYSLKKKEDTVLSSASGSSGFATEVPKGEGLKKFKTALKRTVSGLARLPVSFRELDIAIRQSIDPEFKKKYNQLSVEDREKILSSTPGVAITGQIPSPLIGVDEFGEEVSEYYRGSKAIEFSQKLQEEAAIINESLAQFEKSIGQDLFSVENTGRGLRRLINEVVGALPSIALAMTPGGIYMLGASAGSGKSRRLQEQGEDLTITRYLNAAGTGIAEAYFETYTRGLGNSSFKILKQLYKEGGKSKVKESFRSILYNFGKGFNIEGTSEALTDVSERALDFVLIGDEKAFENFFLETADTYLIGGAAGGPIRVAGPGVRLITQSAEVRNLATKVKESPYSDLVNVFKPETGDFSVDISKLPIVEAPNSELFLKETLKREVKKGKMTPLEMQEVMDNYYAAQNINSQLKGLELSDAAKNKVAALLQEQIALENLIKDKPSALVKKQIDRIAKINKELEKISEGKLGVITEQTATREEAEKALLEEGIESPTEEQIISKLDQIIKDSAPVTTIFEVPQKEGETEVVMDEDIEIAPPTELPLQKVLRKDDDIRKKIEDKKTPAYERKKAVLELISKIQPKGAVFAKRARALIKDVAKLNFNNPKTVEKFIERIDKTFEDAAVKEELSTANTLKKSIAKTVKSPTLRKKINAELLAAAEQFLQIDPNNIDSVKEYIEFAAKVKDGLKPTTKRKGKIKAATPFIIEEVDEYSSQEVKKIEDEESRIEEETYKALMGDVETSIPLKELKELLYPEADLSREEKQRQAKKREKDIRNSLSKGFDSMAGVIRRIIETGVDPFSNEVINLTKDQKDLVERFLKIDTKKLDDLDAAFALDALTNFATNGSTAGMGKLVNNYQGNLEREADIESGLRVSETSMPLKQSFENKWMRGLASLTQVIDWVFKDRGKSNKFSDNSRLSDVEADFAKAETEIKKTRDDYKKEFPNSKKANNEAFNTEDNITERGMFAFTRRSPVGTKKQKQKEFNRRKKLAENDVVAFENSTNPEEKAIGAVYRRVYDKILKDSNNPAEVQAKVDPTNIEAVEWMTEKWREIKPALDKISLEIHNRKMGTEENYTSDVFSYRKVQEMADLDAPISQEFTERKFYDKEAGVMMPVLGPHVLKDRYVNFNFDAGQLNNMEKALAHAYSAENIAHLKGYLEGKDINKILGDGNVKSLVINKIKRYIDAKRVGKRRGEGYEKALSEFVDFWSTVGTARVLGGPTQYIKQTTPIVNTFINAGGELTAQGMELYMTNKKFRDLVKNSGYSIANRGLGSTVIIDELQENVKKKANTPLGKIKKGVTSLWKTIKKANRWWLEKFLLPGDRVTANMSWLVYYAKEMRDQHGVDIFEEGFDIDNHKIDRKAGNEAQRNVDRFQYVSDPDLQGELYAPSEETLRMWMKGVMPFSSFIMNEKTRNYIDLHIILNPLSSFKEKQRAFTSLTGTGLEKAVFHSLGVGIGTGIAFGALKLFGFYDDDDAKEALENRIKGRKGSMVSDFISPIPPVDSETMVFINSLLESVDNPEEGEELFQFFENRNKEVFSKFGVFSIGGQQIEMLINLSKINSEGKLGDYELNKAEKLGVKYLLKGAILNAIGALPSESSSGLQYVYSKLEERASDTGGGSRKSKSMTDEQLKKFFGDDFDIKDNSYMQPFKDAIKKYTDAYRFD